MKRHAHKIGAVFYALWGIIHILGGLIIMMESDPSVQLAMMGTAISPAEFVNHTSSALGGVLSFHGFNILWFGIVVLIVGIRLNWKNNRAGYWINLIVVGASDLGLILFLLIPGYISLSDGFIGPVLLIPALIFSTIALKGKSQTS